jgi:hypothetical protein
MLGRAIPNKICAHCACNWTESGLAAKQRFVDVWAFHGNDMPVRWLDCCQRMIAFAGSIDRDADREISNDGISYGNRCVGNHATQETRNDRAL